MNLTSPRDSAFSRSALFGLDPLDLVGLVAELLGHVRRHVDVEAGEGTVGLLRPRPGWSYLMPILILSPPPKPSPYILSPSPPQAVAVIDRTSAAAAAAVTLRSFTWNILCVVKGTRAMQLRDDAAVRCGGTGGAGRPVRG
ncbi:hypothetical protein SGLAM104S_07146 [Streptomyces glaucescens]